VKPAKVLIEQEKKSENLKIKIRTDRREGGQLEGIKRTGGIDEPGGFAAQALSPCRRYRLLGQDLNGS